MKTKNDFPPDKKLTAVCGLFCPACTLFIGTTENEPQRLKAVADVYGTTSDVWECHGCRSEKRSYFCKNECKMVDCAKERGIDFCVECEEYPCDELRAFKEKRYPIQAPMGFEKLDSSLKGSNNRIIIRHHIPESNVVAAMGGLAELLP